MHQRAAFQALYVGIFIFLVGVIGWGKALGQSFQVPDYITVEDYQPRTVILKLRPEFRALAQANAIDHSGLQQLLAIYGVDRFERKFPRHAAPIASKQRARDQRVDLSLIYEWHYRMPVNMEKVLRQLQALEVFAYAEPKYISRTTFVPNDPRISEQWHLSVIRAFAGWDITTGSAGVTIAIIDTGIDLGHPDLTGKIRQNPLDPINGVDDDGDGFVDNFFGWNLVDNSNDPSITESFHGVHVAGCAAPETNNETGIAGTGYNSLLLPVKVGNDLTVTQGYEGIVYAADHGADIINCSWGGSGPGEFGQDVVNYATFNRNALVVAAMGNNGTDRLFFPASYDDVLAVTATRENDEKAGFANYNFTCDVSAPGQGILSTFDNAGYDLLSGTSMATPITAGCAALVKAQYPSLNALQIGEQLRVTTDNIDAVGGNTAFAGKLGSGRINLERALSGINSPSVVLSDELITDSGNGIFESGDELEISALFTNYLATTGPLTVTLSSTSPLVNVVAGTISLPGLGMLETADNNNQPFRLEVLSTEDINQTVFLQVDITDGTYSSTQYISVLINPDFINLEENNIATTITSRGTVGFNNGANQGLGFRWEEGRNLLFEAGLMIGHELNGRIKVVDRVRGSAGSDRDLETVVRVGELSPSIRSDRDLQGVFDDSGAQSNIIGLEVTHRALAWDRTGQRNFVILEYDIRNRTGSTLENLSAGLFADWDIGSATQNRAATDPLRYLAYTHPSLTDGPFAGIQLLTPVGFRSYGLENVEGGNGGVDLRDDDGFSTEDKYTALTTDRQAAGTGSTSGTDVMQVVSSSGWNLAPGERTVVAFALVAGNSLLELQQAADSAFFTYTGAVPGVPESGQAQFYLLPAFPNPATEGSTLRFDLLREGEVTLEVVDDRGATVDVLLSETLPRGSHQVNYATANLRAGHYLYRLTVDDRTQTRSLVIAR